MDGNAFLRDFMKMRRSLGSPETIAKAKAKEEPKLSGVTLATIIEQKPPAKLVLRYFKAKYGESDSDSD